MLEVHHIGVLVDDIETSLRMYQGLFGEDDITGPYTISSQGVRVSFLKMNKGYLEFVEAVGESSILDMMKKRKVKYYHVGYLTASVEKAIESLVERDFKHVATFDSEAFDGRPCAFLFSPEMHLVELIESA